MRVERKCIKMDSIPSQLSPSSAQSSTSKHPFNTNQQDLLFPSKKRTNHHHHHHHAVFQDHHFRHLLCPVHHGHCYPHPQPSRGSHERPRGPHWEACRSCWLDLCLRWWQGLPGQGMSLSTRSSLPITKRLTRKIVRWRGPRWRILRRQQVSIFSSVSFHMREEWTRELTNSIASAPASSEKWFINGDGIKWMFLALILGDIERESMR